MITPFVRVSCFGMLASSLLAFSIGGLSGEAMAFHPFEGRCFHEERSLEYWVNNLETILVGEVKEVTYHLPSEPPGASACWARFAVKEWLKDSGPSKFG